MHVTLVGGIDPSDTGAGGTRSYVLGLAEHLLRKGVGILLVARDAPATTLEDVEYVRIHSGPSGIRFLARLLTAVPNLPIPIDSIIHVQRPDLLIPFALARPRNPTVCTLHGIPARAVRRLRGPSYGAAYRLLERLGLPHAGQIIAVDAGTASWYATYYPGLAERITVVPVAVDVEKFHPMSREEARHRFRVQEDQVVVYAGRLTSEKRVEAVVRATAALPRTELLIAGGGPEEARLRSVANGKHARFLGTVARQDMPLLLNAADVVVLPSEYEGIPTVALEALACGIPVVATPVGAVPEIVKPGSTGWLVEDIAELGPTIARALTSAGGMRDDCVEAARPYSWDLILDRVLDVYRKAVALA